jgi:hypothetical protein
MRKNTLASLLFAGLLLPACMVSGTGGAYVTGPAVVVEVEEEPPPPRVVVVQPRPGFVWIEGRWTRRGGRWHWHDGHYERVRSGHVWVQGRWERRGNRHVWVEGRWQSGGRHDHRDHRRDDRPRVRDHRR